MGKAAARRKARRRGYLAELSYDNPSRFEKAWEVRIKSWLYEIRRLAREWAAGGEEARKIIFEIVDEAAKILGQCEPSIARKYAAETVSILMHESTAQVSWVVDPRLYRLSNLAQLAYRAPKNARV